MLEKLNSGMFYGQTLQKRHVAGLVLADVFYAADSRLPRHSHAQPYLCLIRRGVYTERFGRRARICGPGVLVFHPQGEVHTQEFGNCPVLSFNVEISSEWLCRLYEMDVVLDQPAEFRCDETAWLGARLYAESESSDAASAIVIESLTAEIFAKEMGRHAFPVKGTPRWLSEARDLLDVRFPDRISLRSLAKEAGVHPVYFAFAFRRHYGCSVGEYLRRMQLKCAFRLLADPESSLAAIALDAGFADQSHFTRAFKRFAGITPARYRTFLRFKTR